MYRVPKYRIQLVRDGSVPVSQRSCATPSTAVELLRAYIGDADREHMVAVYLDSKNRFIGLHTIAVGTVDYCIVNAREVFKAALLCNATSLILAHNHPSGEHAPSQEDIRLTREIAQAAELLDISMLDHIVLGQPGYSSFLELGLLGQDSEAASPPRKKKRKS